MHQDAEHTLPSVTTLIEDEQQQAELILTVLFHPDVRRIGQWARVPRKTSTTAWVLGRHSPHFVGGDSDEGPLADGHISREAVHFSYARKNLTLRRPVGSSRCRVSQGELRDTVKIPDAQLQRGVPLMLSHNTVLLLRLAVPRPATAPVEPCVAPLLGSSCALVRLRERVLEAGRSSLDVLIRGETGSGKELVACALHKASDRSNGPMVSVNMSAIPAELASAALFGSVRGAFTGADKPRAGYFQQAEGGSLFLDEIGDTPAVVQAQLLRALQQREIQTLGGAITAVDLRVISATDAQLDAPEHAFKSALRHRLGACEIVVPALREHPEDIGELLLHFLRQAAAGSDRQAMLPGETADELVIAAWANIFFHFARYAWPGNVRQLQNYAQQLILNMGKLPTLSDNMLQAMENRLQSQPDATVAGTARQTQLDESVNKPSGRPLKRMRDITQTDFDRAMRHCEYEIQRVAQYLGVSRASVYRRIERGSRYRLATDLSNTELREAVRQAGGSLQQAACELGVSLSSLRSTINARKLL